MLLNIKNARASEHGYWLPPFYKGMEKQLENWLIKKGDDKCKQWIVPYSSVATLLSVSSPVFLFISTNIESGKPVACITMKGEDIQDIKGRQGRGGLDPHIRPVVYETLGSSAVAVIQQKIANGEFDKLDEKEAWIVKTCFPFDWLSQETQEKQKMMGGGGFGGFSASSSSSTASSQSAVQNTKTEQNTNKPPKSLEQLQKELEKLKKQIEEKQKEKDKKAEQARLKILEEQKKELEKLKMELAEKIKVQALRFIIKEDVSLNNDQMKLILQHFNRPQGGDDDGTMTLDDVMTENAIGQLNNYIKSKKFDVTISLAGFRDFERKFKEKADKEKDKKKADKEKVDKEKKKEEKPFDEFKEVLAKEKPDADPTPKETTGSPVKKPITTNPRVIKAPEKTI